MRIKLILLVTGCVLVCALASASAQEVPGDPGTYQPPILEPEINLNQPLPLNDPAALRLHPLNDLNQRSPNGQTGTTGGDETDSTPPSPSDLNRVSSAIENANLFWRVSIAKKASEDDRS